MKKTKTKTKTKTQKFGKAERRIIMVFLAGFISAYGAFSLPNLSKLFTQPLENIISLVLIPFVLIVLGVLIFLYAIWKY